MSRFAAFYRNEIVHPDRLTIDEIINWPDTEIESSHNTIQWLFPLPQPSLNVANIPVIDEEEIDLFKKDPNLRNGVLRSFARMLQFYGLKLSLKDGQIVKAKDFDQKSGWLYPRNHNYKRISRILKSLRVLGFESEAKIFFDALQSIYSTHHRYIGDQTWKHWKDAMEGPILTPNRKEAV